MTMGYTGEDGGADWRPLCVMAREVLRQHPEMIEPGCRAVVQRLMADGYRTLMSCGGHRRRTWSAGRVLGEVIRDRPFVLLLATTPEEVAGITRTAQQVLGRSALMVWRDMLERHPEFRSLACKLVPPNQVKDLVWLVCLTWW